MTRTALVIGIGSLEATSSTVWRKPRTTRASSSWPGGLRGRPARRSRRTVDFDALDEASIGSAVDDVFACLGTTIKTAGTEDAFRKVDYGYTLRVAELAKRAGATRIALVTSVGADRKASNLYLRTKGTKWDVEALGWQSLVIARPLLAGENEQRNESRPGERVAVIATRSLAFAPCPGGLRKYRAIDAARVAASTVEAVRAGTPGKHILDYESFVAGRA